MKPKEKAHAKYSASGSHRWLSCPGSVQLCETVPPGKDSKWGKEGTDAHTVLEYLVKNRDKRLSAADFLKARHPLQMVIHAEATLNYIQRRLHQHPGAELLIEVKGNLPVSEPEQFGTADLVIVEHFGRLIVMDYKYGAGIPVHPEENSQLIYYALAVAHLFDYNFSNVELVIIQPRAEVDGKTIRSWSTTIEHLLEWREKFEAGIKKAKGKNPPLLAGEHCRFCPAKIVCPEIKNKALRAAQVAFNDEVTEVAFPKMEALSPERLSKVLPALEKLEIWIDSVREYASDVLETGTKIPGWALVEKRAQRKWNDHDEATRIARKTFGKQAFTDPEILSPAQFEKLGSAEKKFVEKNSSAISSGLTLGRDKSSLAFLENGSKD